MNEINFRINDIKEIKMTMDVGMKEIYPPIVDLKVKPKKEQQVFNHENSYGYNEVTVESIPDEYIIPDGTLPITKNAIYDVKNYAKVSANIYTTPNLQDKEIIINENGTHNIAADEEYDGLNQVSVTVDTGENVAKYTPRIIRFQNYKGEELDYELENIDFSNLTSFTYMFNGCSNIKSIDLSKHNIPTVESVESAFQNDYVLSELKFGNFDSSEIKSMNYLFRECKELKSIDLSSWAKTSQITQMNYAFYNCLSLEFLDIRCVPFNRITSHTSMLTNVPKTCEIIVADSSSKSFFTSNYKSYTNVKTVAEYEG